MRNKLSRKNKPQKAADESFNDFVESKTHSVKSTVKKEDSEGPDPSDEKGDRPGFVCPLCGKDLKGSNDLKRSAHLKLCGHSRGVQPADVLKAKRLEEKHTKEWEELGLPRPNAGPPIPDASTKVNKSKKPKSSHVQSTEDKQLELALALSASMADPESLPVFDEAVKVEAKIPVFNQPENNLRRAKKAAKKVAKTCLEVRTDEARSRQVSEDVAKILMGEINSDQIEVEDSVYNRMFDHSEDASKVPGNTTNPTECNLIKLIFDVYCLNFEVWLFPAQ